MSYANMVMYSSVIPSYDDIKESKKDTPAKAPRYDERLDANNPNNFTLKSNREVVKR